MGISLSQPVAHEEPITIGYRANSIGSTMLVVGGALIILIVPLIIGFAMGQFWITYSTFVETAETRYLGRVALRAVAHDGSEYLWTSSDGMQQTMLGDPRDTAPFFSVLADDSDRDGHPDRYKITVGIPLRDPSHRVETLQLLPTFSFRVANNLVTLEQTVGPFVDVSLPNPSGATRLEIDGRLEFTQTELVWSSPYIQYDKVYQHSYLDDINSIADVAALSRIGRRFSNRNETARFTRTAVSLLPAGSPHSTSDIVGVVPTADDITAAVKSGDPARITGALTGTARSVAEHRVFTAVVTIVVPPATVNYVPSLGESLKAAWIQYFCIAYVVWWVVWLFRRLLVLQAMVNTIALVRGGQKY